MNVFVRAGVAALCKKRLSDIVEVITAKRTESITDTERRIVELARRAAEILGPTVSQPSEGAVRAAPGFVAGNLVVGSPPLNKLAFLGTAAFDLPRYVRYLSYDRALVRLMKRGSSEADVSHVFGKATDFVLRFIQGARSRSGDQRRQAESFALGALCALASEAIVNPVMLGARIDAPGTAFALDRGSAALVARNIFGGRPRPSDWDRWWPSGSEVTDDLILLYRRTFEETYGGDPIAMPDDAQLRHAYTALENLAIDEISETGWGLWIGLGLGLPLIAGMLIGLALPHGRFWVTEAEGTPDHGKAALQWLNLGYSIGILPTAMYTIGLHSQLPGNDNWFLAPNLAWFLRLFPMIGFIAAMDEDADAGAFGLVLGIFALFDLAFAVSLFFVPGRLRFLHAIQLVPSICAVMLLAIAAIIFGMKEALEDIDDETVRLFLAWLIGMVVLLASVITAAILGAGNLHGRGGLEDLFSDESLGSLDDALGVFRRGGPRAALAALFDEAALHRAPGAPATTDLNHRRYPSGKRPLIKVWWTGSGKLSLASDGFQLRVKRESDSAPVIVPLPPPGFDARELAAFLESRVSGLRATAVDADAELHPLPFPIALESFALKEIGTDEGSAQSLEHAAREKLAALIGYDGPSCSQLRGFEIAPRAGLGDADWTAMGYAADLAAILCMAAVPDIDPAVRVSLRGSPPAPASIDPIHQAFRKWNLEDRRLNEWRMLVAGRAASEKVGGDPGMRATPPGYAPRGGEEIANAMGWVPLLRAWLRVAQDPRADSDSARAPIESPPHRSGTEYTPEVSIGGRQPVKPNSQLLTQGLKFLLDLP